MKTDIVKFFDLQRQIFGICPNCDQFFRLSDSQIYLKKKPVLDWMDKLNEEHERLDTSEEKLEKAKEAIRAKAREQGRRMAQRAVQKVDTIFTPRKLNPDDAKVIFHPIDYIVFKGMKSADPIKSIILLDRQTGDKEHRRVQKSIEQVIERDNYEWQTLRVKEDGQIEVE